ncbi:GspH/FimT family protein [Marinobacter halophilus]|uniref:Type II secretion system protein H n=1 Tax=Marinobacter halophilus TaxID=1323740 RepID=A0A2T1KHI9_9GAMM|nr:GspH/FimT family protein [Marinobacter halophilus]PSF09183.1 hypothetical protein C7H08_06195 [Marinobacter halophilus]GGC82643.1 hypothetical protein GCM10011362_33910 [Marinobacter halophilus]
MIKSKDQLGVSLVELVICVVIIAIIASSALPSLRGLLDDGQRRAVINDTLGFMALGRQESVINGSLVTLCPLDDDKLCSRDWSRDLTLFKDPGNHRRITDDEQIIRVLPPPKLGFLKVASLSRSYFQYRPDGMIYSDLGNVTWCPDDRDASKAAHIVVRKGGSIRLAKDSNGDGIPEKSNGDPVSCD